MKPAPTGRLGTCAPAACVRRAAGACLLLALGCLLPADQAQAQVTASIDRSQIAEYDLVTLTLRATGPALSEAPDLTPLHLDFDLRSQREQSSSSISIINGQTTTTNTKEYILTLRPKRTGALQIPPIAFGSHQSQALSLNVAQQAGGAPEPPSVYVFFETSVEPEETYVQGQLIYTVKLFYTDGIGGEFPRQPRGLPVWIETLEKESRYQSVVQGRRYFVLEKRYAIFPQNSGELVLPPETFIGVRGQGGAFAQRQQVQASSRGHRVKVKPIPPSFTGAAWLPAKSLTLQEAWNQAPPRFRVGEPVNRQLAISALGLTESLLPALDHQDLPNAKIYADPPSVSKQLSEAGVAATQTTSVGIVPTREGQLRLPEIRIPWWNTDADREEVAVIPAQTYEILPGTGVVTAPPAQLPTAPQAAAEAAALRADGHAVSRLWQYLAGALTLLWLASTWQWRRTRQALRDLQAAARAETPAPTDPDEARLYKALESACKQNRPAEAHAQLLLWARVRNPALGSLADLAPRNAALATEIQTLEALLYKEGKASTSAWRGKQLASLLASLRTQPQERPKQAPKPHQLATRLNPGTN